MMALSFSCPGCGVNIHTTMYDVLQMGFSCGMCGKTIVPDAIFREGKLDREKEMLAWIGEAAVNYMNAHESIMQKAKEDGIHPLDARIGVLLNPASAEVYNRVMIYKGENYGE